MTYIPQAGWDNMGMQFFFDWNESSKIQRDQYDQVILTTHMTPLFVPTSIPAPMSSFVAGAAPPGSLFVFFAGHVQPQGQISMPYDGSAQGKVLQEILNRGLDTIHMVGVFGSWLSRSGWAEEINAILKSKKIGYVGLTYAVKINSLQSYRQFAQSLGLSER